MDNGHGLAANVLWSNKKYYYHLMENFTERRFAELELLSFLTRIDSDTYSSEKGAIYIEPKVCDEESDEDRYLFLTKLKRSNNLYYSYFERLQTNTIKFTTRIDFKTYYGYQNVFSYDDLFMNGIPGYSHRCVEADENGGWVWLFWSESSPLLGMIGIRVSVPLFLQGVRGTATQLLEKVFRIAKESGKSHLIVPNPLWGMRGILTKHGFERIEESDTENTRFISPIEKTNIYYIRPIHT